MKKVVIIGAGPAGLTAAYELLKSKEKYEVIILEETNEIGGEADGAIHRNRNELRSLPGTGGKSRCQSSRRNIRFRQSADKLHGCGRDCLLR